MCATVTSQSLQCRRQMNSANFKRYPTHTVHADSACAAIHQTHWFLISVLKQIMPLHMEWVAGNNIEKRAANTRKIIEKKTWCQKEKQCQLSGIISATRRMILTKHVFCVDSALHLLPQQEVTQLICLTIYVSTTQLSTTKRDQISAS